MMNVAELISQLSKLDQDAQVVVFSPMCYYEDLLPEAITSMLVCELPPRFVHRRPYAPREGEKVRAYLGPDDCEQNSPIVRAVLIAQ
jgi:hypothetical protein